MIKKLKLKKAPNIKLQSTSKDIVELKKLKNKNLYFYRFHMQVQHLIPIISQYYHFIYLLDFIEFIIVFGQRRTITGMAIYSCGEA